MIQSAFYLWILLQCSAGLEIFLQNNHGHLIDSQHLNGTYSIPLLTSRKVLVRINAKLLQNSVDNNKRSLVAFRLQAKTKEQNVVELENEISLKTSNDGDGHVLLEDLFILKNQKKLGQIFNAYPSPSLKYLDDEQAVHASWIITSIAMDQTLLTVRLDLFFSDGKIISEEKSISILVTQPQRVIDRIFHIIIPFIVIFISIKMGILLDTQILWELVRKPKAVLIGFLAQYGLMPFLAMAIAKIFRYSPLHSLALFIIGCCPGSGASNQWTLLFDGDVNLSAVMSFVSTASSFIMMPLYFYTIGRTYMDELSIRVPFLGLCRSLALVVVPYSTGILISHFFPKVRPIVERMVKPMMLFLLIFFMVFGVIVNWYMLKMIELQTALTAPLLPYLGFIFGAVLAWLFRLEWSHVKTIGIEAGIQNVGIAFMIMLYSFPQPFATKALVVPLVVGFLTTKPFWLVYVIRSRYKKYKTEKQTEKSASNEHQEIPLTNEKPCEKDEDLV